MTTEPSPFVSIGMPVYNGERHIGQALDSLLSQTFQNFELIISDDASTDATGRICTEYASKDRRIRYYRQEQNLGITGNFNRVLQLSTSPDYFMWAAQDDWWDPTYIERCVNVLESISHAVFCSPKVVYVDRDGNEAFRYDSDFTTTGMSIPQRIFHYLKNALSGSLFYGLIRASAIKDKSLVHILGQDFLLMVELLLEGHIVTIDEYLFKKKISGATESLLKGARSYGTTSRFKVHWHRAFLFTQYFSVVLRSDKLSIFQKASLFLDLVYAYFKYYFYHDLTRMKVFRAVKKLAYVKRSGSKKEPTMSLKILLLFCLPFMYLLHYGRRLLRKKR